jgi:predicted nucleic acid-binding protein
MEQAKIVLCDTDVMIEFYRGNPEIVAELKAIGQKNIAISYITAGELIFGAFNKRDLAKLKKDIEHLVLLDIDNKACGIFINLMSTYALSHHLAVPDGFIAATAIATNVELFTLNKRDFKFIEGIKLYKH